MTISEETEISAEGTAISIATADGVLSARHFAAAGDELSTGPGGRPCIVMAHGIGATQDSGLWPFAAGLAAAGAEVITFDYRHFAGSDGQPRQLVSLEGQIEDYHAAVAHARGMRGVDADRVYVWGVSLSGGHVIRVAAEDPRIAGVFALTPAVDGLPVLIGTIRSYGIGYALRLLAYGAADAVAGLRGRAPLLIPIVGAPGTIAGLTADGAMAGMLATAGPSWRNEFAARLTLAIGRYRPGRRAGAVHCPALVQIADCDQTAPPEAAARAASRMRATVHHYPCDHFDIYPGASWHEHVLGDQVAFLRRVATPVKSSEV